MTVDFSYSQFLYLDTNILSLLAKQQDSWKALRDYCMSNDLTLAVTGAQLAELSEATRIHHLLAGLFLMIPSALLLPSDQLLDIEIASYPDSIASADMLMYPINQLLLEPNGPADLSNFLSSEALSSARQGQLDDAKKIAAVLQNRKKNFGPSANGSYHPSQAQLFAYAIAIQWLGTRHADFLMLLQTRHEYLEVEAIRTIALFAYVVFFKYYLGRRKPKRLSDFGDLMHLAYIPYCSMAIMERDLCEVLNQIKKHSGLLNNTHIYNVDYLSNWGVRF